jgi:ABC-2 type transport system permease protein
VLIFMPVLQVILFGFAIRTDVNDVRLAIVDPTPDQATVALRARLEGAGVFHTVRVVRRTEELEPLFASGTAQQAVVFPSGFAGRIARGLPARVLVITDATEPNTGSAMQGYAQAVIQDYARELRADGSARGAGLVIVPLARMRFNPTRESSNLFVPGLLAMVLTITSALMTALTITREKEIGTMEAMLVSPLRPRQIIAGKVTPYLAIGFAALVLVIVEARLVFDVPLRGSVLLLLAEGLLFILVSLSLGILISARTSSQRVAMMGALVGTMLPTLMLSGFIFPVESMPAVLQWISNIVPARWFVLIARGIMLKGVGLTYLWRETLILAAMALVLLVLSTRSFRVRLE